MTDYDSAGAQAERRPEGWSSTSTSESPTNEWRGESTEPSWIDGPQSARPAAPPSGAYAAAGAPGQGPAHAAHKSAPVPPNGSSLDSVQPHSDVSGAGARIASNIETVIDGKPGIVQLSLAVLLSEGHLLIEDVPGVGKTKLAKALARSIDCSVRRIQFTPDLLPSDVTGVSIYSADARDFEFRPGAVFANIVVGDEINRASPKTQSALLECMEERQVTVDGTTYPLETPFLVLATQNPIEMEGTYPLPEAQRDRFTARISMGYPDRDAEMTMLSDHAAVDPLEKLRPCSDASEVRSLIKAVRAVYVSDAVKGYAVDIAEATRQSADLRLGASPRAVLQLIRVAKAWAALDSRSYVTPDDIQQLAGAVLIHRLLVTPEAQIARRGPKQVLDAILSRVRAPSDPAALSRPQR